MKAVRAKTNNWTQEIVLLLQDEVASDLQRGDRVMVPWLLGSTNVYPREIVYVQAEIL